MTLMMYVFPLMLGRTFDLNRMQVGVDIFPVNETANPMTTDQTWTNVTNGLFTDPREIQTMLLSGGIPGPYNLHMKAGLLKSGAAEAYMTEPFNRAEVVEYLLITKAHTVIDYLSYDAQPIPTWKEMQGLGTHYVKGVIYGAELIVSLRFICNSTEDQKRVRDAINNIYGFGREDKYDKNITQFAESMQIKVFSSVPLQKIPQNMESLQQLLDNEFVEALRQQNGGKGVPIMVILEPFDENLDHNWPSFDVNKELHLDNFELQYDDLRNAKSAIDQWMKTLTVPLTPEFEKKIGDLYKRIQDVMQSYNEVIASLDMRLGNEQLKPAIEKYGGEYEVVTFYVQFDQLRRELESKS